MEKYIIRQILNELGNIYIYDQGESINNDYSSGYLAGVKEAILQISYDYGWSEEEIKLYFNKSL